MRLKIDKAQLQATIARALIPATPGPDPADLIELYLFLPAVYEHPTAGRLQVRSSLEALLTDAHRVTGRDDDGNVVDPGRLGTWLGAMGYLALIDQVGKAIRWTDRPDEAPTPFETIVRQRGLSGRDAATMYALRNAMVHSFGLANEYTKRPELTHFFRLNIWGGAPLVEYDPRTGRGSE